MEEVDDQKGGESVYRSYLHSNPCHLFDRLVNSLLKCLGLIHHDYEEDDKEDPPSSDTEKQMKTEEERRVETRCETRLLKRPPRPEKSKGRGGQIH